MIIVLRLLAETPQYELLKEQNKINGIEDGPLILIPA